MSTSETTLAIILGASEWPKCEDTFTSSESFRKSAADFKKYLLSDQGFRLSSDNLLDLFNNDDASPNLVTRISEFLDEKCSAHILDVLVYYVGHGAFTSGGRYYLSIRSTMKPDYLGSSITPSSLRTALDESTKNRRRHLIIDSCYAASVPQQFQEMGGGEGAFKQIMETFPDEGTGALVSSGSSASNAVGINGYTMFSGALLKVLEEGSREQQENLSLRNLYRLIRDRLRSEHTDAILPEIHAPEQRDGDVTSFPLFPNYAGLPERMSKEELVDLVKQQERELQDKTNKLVNIPDFYRFTRDVICFTQEQFPQYIFVTSEKHKALRKARQKRKPDLEEQRVLVNELIDYLNVTIKEVVRSKFDFLLKFFSIRHATNPRLCVKGTRTENKIKYLVPLFRHKKVDYYSRYRLVDNEAFQTVHDKGWFRMDNNIPNQIVDGNYHLSVIDKKKVKNYVEQGHHEKTYVGDYDWEWVKCWKKRGDEQNVDPRSCVKSSIMVPMTLMNSKLTDTFRAEINQKLDQHLHGEDISRIVFGYLAIDHLEAGYFRRFEDEDIGYIFADILSLYMITRLLYTDFSDTFKDALNDIRQSEGEKTSSKAPRDLEVE